MAGLAHECPDTNRLSFERTAGPSLQTPFGTAWPHKSLPSPEWPITGLPAPPKQPLTNIGASLGRVMRGSGPAQINGPGGRRIARRAPKKPADRSLTPHWTAHDARRRAPLSRDTDPRLDPTSERTAVSQCGAGRAEPAMLRHRRPTGGRTDPGGRPIPPYGKGLELEMPRVSSGSIFSLATEQTWCHPSPKSNT